MGERIEKIVKALAIDMIKKYTPALPMKKKHLFFHKLCECCEEIVEPSVLFHFLLLFCIAL